MDKNQLRRKFIEEHPDHPTVTDEEGEDISNTAQGSKNHGYTKKVKPGICPQCEMRLTSEYHMQYPCK